MSVSKVTPLEERIRQRAHAIWEERQKTGREGDAFSDWFEAETELQGETATLADSKKAAPTKP